MKMKKVCGVCAAWTGVASVMQIVREATMASASKHLISIFQNVENENERDYAGISDKYMLTMKLGTIYKYYLYCT